MFRFLVVWGCASYGFFILTVERRSRAWRLCPDLFDLLMLFVALESLGRER